MEVLYLKLPQVNFSPVKSDIQLQIPHMLPYLVTINTNYCKYYSQSERFRYDISHSAFQLQAVINNSKDYWLDDGGVLELFKREKGNKHHFYIEKQGQNCACRRGIQQPRHRQGGQG